MIAILCSSVVIQPFNLGVVVLGIVLAFAVSYALRILPMRVLNLTLDDGSVRMVNVPEVPTVSSTGNVVTGRKGGVFMHLEVLGRAAHSGGNYADGRSAILELAHKTVALHALTDLAWSNLQGWVQEPDAAALATLFN